MFTPMFTSTGRRTLAATFAVVAALGIARADSLLTMPLPDAQTTKPAEQKKEVKPAHTEKNKQPTTEKGTKTMSTEKSVSTSTSSSALSDRATYLISNQRMHSDPTILTPGFLSGLRGFEHFHDPVGDPLYFESPFNDTSLRLLYLWHQFPKGSQIGGGDLSVFAAQIRLALTERLAFIATKDGYSVLNAGITPPDQGWNDFAIGLKYLFIVDRANDFVLAGGMRWEWENGDREVLQGSGQELSPFVSFAKGFDRFHLLGNVTTRIPTDYNDGNYIVSWGLHADYEAFPKTLPGFAPLVEIHGLHYLTNGEALPLSVGGLDYSNIGSDAVAGDGVISGGVGFDWRFTPHWSTGAAYEFPLSNPDNDIMGNRVTLNMKLSY